MEIVLGVSMTPTAVRMVLVDGEKADGVTVDHDTFPVGDPATPGAAGQVIAAILGTRESAAEGGHRLVSTGVAWSDHATAAELRDALRAHGIVDVALVSELHAASALAQAVGQAADYGRTALIFVEDGPAASRATLAVVQTTDGAVVRVWTGDPAAVTEMVAALESLADPPEAVFLVGSGLDIAALKDQISGATTLPVHAPQDADLALARGAALAAANSPRFEAETVGLASAGDFETAAGITQAAPAGYMAPLGYSAVPDDPDGDVLDLVDAADPADADPVAAPERKPFLLVGSALSTVFVVGVAALVISLAVSIRPTADQRPAPPPAPSAPSSEVASPAAANPAPVPAPQTIQAPVPVVQVAPRTVYVTPAQKAPAPMLAPAPVVAPAPVPEQIAAAPEPAAPPPAPVAPAPVIPPAVVAPIIPPWLRAPVMPQFPNAFTPVQSNPVPAQTDPAVPASPPATVAQQSPPATVAQQSPPATVAQQSPSRDSGGRDASGGGRDDGRSREGRTHSNPLWPEFPMPFG